MTRKVLAGFFCLALAAACAWADEGTKLLRFPDIHGDTVAFSYGGDLWLASTDGGTAWRLTAHPGQELFPRFSFHPMENGLLSRASTKATNKSMLFPQAGVNRQD